MPKRKTTDENSILYHDIINSPRCYLKEPSTLHIMKEMDVKPLSSPFLIDDCLFESDTLNEKRPLQTVNGSKRRMLLVPEKSPSFKVCQDDFVFFQQSPPFQPQEDHFSKLSDEIILYIFQWLPKSSLIKCAEVCRRWKNISYDESLWTRYDLSKRYIQPGVLETLIERGISVLRLATSEIKPPIFPTTQLSNRQRFSKLQYLDLSMATVSAECLAELLSVCNSFKKLSLEACTLNEDCSKFIAQNKQLEVLNMSMCKGLSGSGLLEIASNCVKLKEWNLAWTQLNRSCLGTFLPRLTSRLTKLNISGHPVSFDDIALITVLNRCPNLIELDISDCLNVTGTSFMKLIEVCKKLQHLHTSRCYNIPIECNRYLKTLKNFRNLEIFQTHSEEVIAHLRKWLPQVKINSQPFSTIARPTTGIKRTSIWGLRVRE